MAARGDDGSQRRQQQRQQPDTGGGRPRRGSAEGGHRQGEYIVDTQGNFILDVHGNKIAYDAPSSSYAGSDAEADYQTPATTNPPRSGGPESPTTSGGEPRGAGAYSDPQDYSGQGYGAPGWETVPRHHHPTRLSDVIEEEDERSRTSASQMSRG